MIYNNISRKKPESKVHLVDHKGGNVMSGVLLAGGFLVALFALYRFECWLTG